MSAETIRVLPDHVANKIAAGEVVDRPASIVKEMVENAFDAGATRIEVEIVSGGRKLVSIADNGHGMARENALLAVERHATSKIRDVDDIEHISSLGFRGEALAAISSVSRFRLCTCAEGEEVGTELVMTAGKMSDVRDFARPVGTTFEVRDLFFNVPARRKFLRTPQTELSHIRTLFMHLALGHPRVAMLLKVDGRMAWQLPAGNELADRIRDLMGREYMEHLLPVDYTARDVTVTGFTGKPSYHRGDRYEQYITINGRASSAPVLGHAIRESYRTLMPGDRNPCLFIDLQLDASLVDVNVHPTKKEVRFRRGNDVRDTLIEALRGVLVNEGQATGGFVSRTASAMAPPAATQQEMGAFRIDGLPQARRFDYPAPDFGAATVAATPGRGAALDGPEPAAQTDHPASDMPADAPWRWCRVLGQVGGLFVLLETDEGLVVMDPHAAHERVLFDRYMAQVRDKVVAEQALLTPESVELGPRDATRIRKHLDTLRCMGFGICEFGGDAFVVDALPADLASAAPRELLVELVAALEESGARGGAERTREECIAGAACKAAVKAHDLLHLQEVEKLVADLARTELPYTCPHGRPTLIFMSFKELRRKFARE